MDEKISIFFYLFYQHKFLGKKKLSIIIIFKKIDRQWSTFDYIFLRAYKFNHYFKSFTILYFVFTNVIPPTNHMVKEHIILIEYWENIWNSKFNKILKSL